MDAKMQLSPRSTTPSLPGSKRLNSESRVPVTLCCRSATKAASLAANSMRHATRGCPDGSSRNACVV